MGELLRFPQRETQIMRNNGTSALEPEDIRHRPQVQLVQTSYPEQSISYLPVLRFYDHVFKKDLKQLEILREFSKRKLSLAGFETSEESSNFEIDKERWNFERCKTEKEKLQFQRELDRQIVTALWEREQGKKVQFGIKIDEHGELWSELWDKDPLSVIYQRGLVLKQQEFANKGGSPEPERDEQEVRGQEIIKQEFTSRDARLGKKAIVISGKGMVMGTASTYNFVDGYELVKEEVIENGKKVTREKILYTRFSSTLEYKDYMRIALEINPKYFDGFLNEFGKEVMPIDAWFKGHPLILSEKLPFKGIEAVYEKYFDETNTRLEQEAFQQRLHALQDERAYIVAMITQQAYDPVTCAIAVHNLYIEGDKLRAQQEERDTFQTVVRSKTQTFSLPQWGIQHELSSDMLRKLAAQSQRNVSVQAESMQAGCGSSSGLKTKNNGVRSMFSNSIASFTLKNSLSSNSRGEAAEDGQAVCEASLCERDTSDNHYHCPGCKKTYDSEEGKSTYTQECEGTAENPCDFKFGCKDTDASSPEDQKKESYE